MFSKNSPLWMAPLLGLLLVSGTVYLGAKSWSEMKSAKWIDRGGAVRDVVSVNGIGKIKVSPDIAILTIGIVNEDKNVFDAQNRNAATINNIIGGLRSMGVSGDDIQTSTYSVYPVYTYPENLPRLLNAYEVRQSLTVKIRDLENTGKVLAKVAELGANEINGPTYTMEDPEPLKKEARAKAIENATEKATEMSAQLGLSLGKITSYSEYDGGSPIVYDSYLGKGGMGGGSVVESNWEAGKLEVISNVTITYEVKK
ncbi:MAG: hypothetical protein G01um101418_468 [Parcubacteria group bacterium Gr01-1014_18]|nr:MAG: hypothetical protein Greene041636_514 [Parcubacteria group bacterium Greene0416_36]TSC81055.1 MAG: hypothetical protein G01um101418_468 [Parcubacteria group bacterium Gr01-1014_18]TSC98789.1 MAG: hypothetical protein Greene101420_539 [Parcubacteria group bacterium Greene1014_20]TSD06731.1 MAG: hypothetical protein Greene07142_652 [Parcubacteria group bacterium Greene0714_2]